MSRRRLSIHDAGCLQPHDHVAWFGDGDGELYSVATAALGDGADRNEKLLFVAEAPDSGRLRGIDGLDRLLASGQLELLALDAVYGTDGAFSASDQLATFEGVPEGALADGYRGIRVVADNTRLVREDRRAFRRWLAWEQLTDRFQAASMVTGICVFDRGALSGERQAELAALHPVRSTSSVEPPFCLFSDGDALVVTGRLDGSCAERFRRMLETVPVDRPLVMDVSAAGFGDPDALLAIAELASATRPVRIRGREHVRRLLADAGLTTPQVRFEPAPDAVRRCTRCGDVIGVYEPTIVVLHGDPRATSIAAEPDLVATASERYHHACSPGR